MHNDDKRDDTKQEEGRDMRPAVRRDRDADRPFLSLRDAMNRLFDESFLNPFEGFSDFATRLPVPSRVFPRVDVSESENEVKVVANIPGIDPDKVDIEVGEDYLALSGTMEKETEGGKKDAKYYRYEREYGEFSRTLPLPTRVKTENVSAKCKNGVLTITLPKSEAEKKQRVKVEKE